MFDSPYADRSPCGHISLVRMCVLDRVHVIIWDSCAAVLRIDALLLSLNVSRTDACATGICHDMMSVCQCCEQSPTMCACAGTVVPV